VRDEQNRQGFTPGYLIDQVQHFLLHGDVQIGGRFVQKQQVRFLENRARQRHLLPFSAGQMPQRAMSEMGHAHHVQKAQGLPAVVGGRRTEKPGPAHGARQNGLESGNRKGRIDVQHLRHVPDTEAGAAGPSPGFGFAEKMELA